MKCSWIRQIFFKWPTVDEWKISENDHLWVTDDVLNHVYHRLLALWKESLNSITNIYKWTITSHLKSLNTKKTMTYDIGNLGRGLGQAQKCGGLDLFYDLTLEVQILNWDRHKNMADLNRFYDILVIFQLFLCYLMLDYLSPDRSQHHIYFTRRWYIPLLDLRCLSLILHQSEE